MLFRSNVKDYSLGLNFINALRPVSYIYNNNDNGIVYNGFIAQEVEQTLKKLGMEFSGLCKPQNENDHYSLRYAEFTVPLVKAVQEQQKIIDSLKFQVSSFKLENENLKAENAVILNEVKNLKAEHDTRLKTLEANLARMIRIMDTEAKK